MASRMSYPVGLDPINVTKNKYQALSDYCHILNNCWKCNSKVNKGNSVYTNFKYFLCCFPFLCMYGVGVGVGVWGGGFQNPSNTSW